jgi:hypothetical protein
VTHPIPKDDHPAAVEPHYGSTVRGRQRFSRPEIGAEFDSVLLGGNGAKLFGLRRMGKSTEAVACAERLRTQGLTVVEIDTQGLVSEADLLMRLFASLPAKGWGDRVLQAIGGDGNIAAVAREALRQQNREGLGDVNAYFNTIAVAIERALAAGPAAADNAAQGRILLFVDELPWLCRRILEGDEAKGRQRIDQLFAALRRWRDSGMGMLLIGSIGLVGLGREYRLDMNHLNDLTTLSVPPLGTADEAAAFVNALAAGGQTRGWSPVHTQAVLDESAAYYPAMLQKAFQVLTIGGAAAALERIADLFADKVRPELDKTFFEQFDRRIKLYRAIGEPLAKTIPLICEVVLAAAAPISRDEIRRHIGADLPPSLDEPTAENPPLDEADLGDALEMLREDGFIDVRVARDGSQLWRAASPLVRAWRIRRRGGR